MRGTNAEQETLLEETAKGKCRRFPESEWAWRQVTALSKRFNMAAVHKPL